MKLKLAMLLVVAVCSSMIVASAQTGLPRVQEITVAEPFLAQSAGVTPPEYRINSFFPVPGAQSQEEAQLAHQAGELARQLGGAKSDADRDKLKTQLSTILEKQFELRQQRHKKEIESLEAQVKKLRDLVDKRQENRREIIAKRLDQILQESQGLGW
jgi:hypothetical protein